MQKKKLMQKMARLYPHLSEDQLSATIEVVCEQLATTLARGDKFICDKRGAIEVELDSGPVPVRKPKRADVAPPAFRRRRSASAGKPARPAAV